MNGERNYKLARTLSEFKCHVPSSTESELQATVKAPRQLSRTPVTSKLSKIPVKMETPPSVLREESAHAIMMETPPASKGKPVKRRPKKKRPWWQGSEAIDIGNLTRPGETGLSASDYI